VAKLIMTDRALASTRIKEHRRAVRVCDSNSKIDQHANQFGHSMDFDRTTIVDKARDYRKKQYDCSYSITKRKQKENFKKKHLIIVFALASR